MSYKEPVWQTWANFLALSLTSSLLGVVIDIDQSESGVKALGPFKIIHQRPVKISFDIHPLLHGQMDIFKMALDKFPTLMIVIGANAIFRDDHRQIIFFKI